MPGYSWGWSSTFSAVDIQWSLVDNLANVTSHATRDDSKVQMSSSADSCWNNSKGGKSLTRTVLAPLIEIRHGIRIFFGSTWTFSVRSVIIEENKLELRFFHSQDARINCFSPQGGIFIKTTTWKGELISDVLEHWRRKTHQSLG